jgi:von Willebrand factor type A domain
MIHRNKTTTIICVVFAAMLLHGMAMFWIKDMKIDFSTSGRALMENQKAGKFNHEQEAAKQEEIKRKNLQLAEALKSLVQDPPKEQNLNYDVKHVQPETFAVAIDEIDPKLENPVDFDETGLGSPIELIDSLASLKHSINEERQSSKYLRRPTSVEILYPQDEYMAEELIMATEMALGYMEPEIKEDVSIANPIKAGKMEEASIKGTSLQNRSGMLDQGLAEAVMGSGGSFSLSSEFGIWNYHAFSQKKPMLLRDALLPMTNKDELRGFDYNSLGAIASSDDFNLTVEYAPKKDNTGYFFKLELFPKAGIKFKRIKQNIFFLIDRSHSIRFSRYEMTKTAVAKALALLHAGDSFNVLVFDDSIARLSPGNLAWNPMNVYQAREFIKNQKYGGIFASTDLYSSLGLIVPEAVAENEVNTAILLSDGDTYLSSEKQRNSIGNWTKKNSGKVSLYTMASGKGNHLALLDLLSVLNKGSLHYSTTDKGLEGTLFNLMQGIRNPIGKDITVTTLASTPDLKIETYPINQFLANLYENTPYVIYGVINQLKDFHVFFQGRYYDKYLDIKQAVSFKNATRVDSSGLEKKWALQEAYVSYSKYLEDGQPDHLIYAKQLLIPYRIPIAFK